MRIKKFKFFDKDNKVNNSDRLIENVNYHRTRVSNLGSFNLPDPQHGDLKLSVMPFENNGEWVSLPEGFKMWEDSFNDVLRHIPLEEGNNTHYLTIDTKFFTTDDFLRREGIHIDGNFCVDPYFTSVKEMASWGGASYNNSSWGGAKYEPTHKSSWGGASSAGYSSWGGARSESFISNPKLEESSDGVYKVIREGKFETLPNNKHVKMDWVLPYDITIPISEYVSADKGGILTVSTEIGAQAWTGDFYGEVLSEGDFSNMENQLTDENKVIFEKNTLYFMSSNTPHETLMIDKGKRRTFLRITLNHNYNNKLIK